MVGVPSASTAAQPLKQPFISSAWSSGGLGRMAIGRMRQYSRFSLTAWPQPMLKDQAGPRVWYW